MTTVFRRVTRRLHPCAALLVGLAVLGAAPAVAQEGGRKHGWADEVKRSLDKPDQSPAERTGSTNGAGRESSPGQSSDRAKAGGRGNDQPRL